MASWKDLLASASTPRTLQRAREALGKGTVYELGKGGFDPAKPLAARSDCSGFVCWAIGVPRELPPRSGRWLQTDTFWGGGPPVGKGLFHQVAAGEAAPGDIYVYPDYKAGGKPHQGHIGIISKVTAGTPAAVIHCASGNKPDAIQETAPDVFSNRQAARIMRVDYDALRGLFEIPAPAAAAATLTAAAPPETLKHSLLRDDAALQQVVAARTVLSPTGQPVGGCAAVQDGLNHLASRYPECRVDWGDDRRYRGYFGPKTADAIRAFQGTHGIQKNGLIGHDTVLALDAALRSFDAGGLDATRVEAPPAQAAPSLLARCLTLTGQFETGVAPPDSYAGLTGNFDGQGISFGVLQWNIGTGSLQPLLQAMDKQHPAIMQEVFGANCAALRAMLKAPHAKQKEWACSVTTKKTVKEPWRSYFKALGRRIEFQEIQNGAVASRFTAARKLCADYGLWSERGVALMFDIVTQNGSIKAATKKLILADIAKLSADLTEAEREVARMRIIANRRADAVVNKEFVADVRARKLAIAEGKGKVHGAAVDLEKQFDIGLRKAVSEDASCGVSHGRIV